EEALEQATAGGVELAQVRGLGNGCRWRPSRARGDRPPSSASRGRHAGRKAARPCARTVLTPPHETLTLRSNRRGEFPNREAICRADRPQTLLEDVRVGAPHRYLQLRRFPDAQPIPEDLAGRRVSEVIPDTPPDQAHHAHAVAVYDKRRLLVNADADLVGVLQ